MSSDSLHDLGVVLPCAGSGTRVGAPRPKQFLELGGRPVFHRSLSTFLGHPRVRKVVLVVAAQEEAQVRYELGNGFGSLLASGRLVFAQGGAERWQSVRNGVAALDKDCPLVAIHDVARPFLNATDIDAVVAAATADGAATLAIPCPDTVKWASEAIAGAAPLVERTIDRSRIWLTQTPQAFRREVLDDCYAKLATKPDFAPTDEAGIAEAFGHPVRLVRGAERLRKITSAEDLEWARWMAGRVVSGVLG
ncbi:MAG: 2-C-methyl-D-erythritol 4-phosphate cytidylyltransferase [Fibrobacteres bacterium]|nr:2-C-methyl-D-erythritol 4-phosphate cytidylyltransferase [Fibrobacterota bacterium]